MSVLMAGSTGDRVNRTIPIHQVIAYVKRDAAFINLDI